MYLADVFRTTLDGLSPEDKKALPSPIVPFKLGLADYVLRDAELYAFDKSALQMASHLRIGDPAELHRVLQSVLSGPPSTLFLEADGLERAETLTHLRNTVIRPFFQDEAMPSRAGLLIQILGNGQARYRPIWNFCDPQDDLTLMARTMLRKSNRHGFKRSALQERAFLEIMRLDANPGWTEINVVDDPDYPTIDKFAWLTGNGDKIAEGIMNCAQSQSFRGLFERKLTHDETLQIAWWSYCTHQMTHPGLHSTEADLHYINGLVDTGFPKSRILQEARNNCDGELTNIAAMLSVLSAGAQTSRDPVVVSEERPARDRLVRSPRQVKHIRQDRLRVVSLNVSDAAIFQRARGARGSESLRAGTRRTRHFVNGHLFLARNGHMTWRRPHWRGSELGNPVLTRVR